MAAADAKYPPIKWAQRKDSLWVTFDIQDSDDVEINLAESTLKFKCKTSDDTFDVTMDLWGEVDPEDEESKYDVTPREIVFHIMKKDKEADHWPYLLKDKSISKAHCAVDWDRYMDQDDEEEAGAGGAGFDMSQFGGGGMNFGGMGGAGGMPGGMGGMPGMGGMGGGAGGMGGMDIQQLMAQMGQGGAGGMPGMGGMGGMPGMGGDAGGMPDLSSLGLGEDGDSDDAGDGLDDLDDDEDDGVSPDASKAAPDASGDDDIDEPE